MRIGSFNQAWWDEAREGQLRCRASGQVRIVHDCLPSSALTSIGVAFARRVLDGLRFCCRFEVRQTVQKGEGLAGDGWEQHMMTHEGLAPRLLICSLRLPSWELSGMELAL
jgi:hypothetical protein